MQHFAEIDNENLVLRVIVIDDKNCSDEQGNISEEIGAAFCNKITDSIPVTRTSKWVLTFTSNDNVLNRKNFAGKGDYFDEVRNAFYPLKPFDNWIFDEVKCTWVPPVPYPTDGLVYSWNQEENMWVLL